MKEIFNSFIEHNDPLGMYLFVKNIDIEVYIELHKQMIADVKRGNKGDKRNEHDEMMARGEIIFLDIKKAIEDDDHAKYLENTEDCLEKTKELLAIACR